MTTVEAFSAETRGSRWRVWLIAGILALLWHLFFFWVNPSFETRVLAPPRVEIHQIDPHKLEAIREQWRHQQEKQLLLDKNPNAPKDAEAPKDARYESDRNIRVQKEQRARVQNVIPKPGTQALPRARVAQQPRQRSERHAQALPNLSDLGLPFHLGQKSGTQSDPRREQEMAQNSSAPEGGDQSILDRKLPEGSENLLNAQESVYYSFYARLYQEIAPIWQNNIREVPYKRRVLPGEYSTQVDVICDGNGNLLEVRQLHSSGIPEFDAAVSESWRKIGRFPNPPRGLLDESGQVHTGWTFTVEVGDGFNLDYLPPERDY